MSTDSASERPHGAFIVLVGPDGVGKTTVAQALIDLYVGPAAYFHFLPPTTGPLADGPNPISCPPPPKANPDGSPVLGWLRLTRNAARCWVGYLRSVRPAVKRQWLVVGDRWMYGYLVQREALRFYGPDILARMVVRLLPRPDLIVNLSAPSSIIRTRKQELTIREIEEELVAWSSLLLPNMLTLDATRSPEDVAEEILAILARS